MEKPPKGAPGATENGASPWSRRRRADLEEVVIEGPQHVVLHDVLVGDVWLCGGQSNMAFGLRGARGGVDEAKTANLPQLRFFTVATRSAYAPVDVPHGQWRTCTPETAPGFSAVGYFFGRRL